MSYSEEELFAAYQRGFKDAQEAEDSPTVKQRIASAFGEGYSEGWSTLFRLVYAEEGLFRAGYQEGIDSVVEHHECGTSDVYPLPCSDCGIQYNHYMSLANHYADKNNDCGNK